MPRLKPISFREHELQTNLAAHQNSLGILSILCILSESAGRSCGAQSNWIGLDRTSFDQHEGLWPYSGGILPPVDR
jgi:hypothetical protein